MLLSTMVAMGQRQSWRLDTIATMITAPSVGIRKLKKPNVILAIEQSGYVDSRIIATQRL